MKFKVTLKSESQYLLDAESEEEAIKIVSYSPMYKPEVEIKELKDFNTIHAEEVEQ